jgi:hypothetical protein
MSSDLTTLANLKAYLGRPVTWVKSTATSVGDNVRANNAQYVCITSGTTASSGSGPSGTSADITDGTVHWKWVAVALTNDDALLSRLISAVSTAFASYCDRQFESASHTYVTSGHGGPMLPLPETPVTAISAVMVDAVLIHARPAVGSAGWVQVDNAIFMEGYVFSRRGVANVSVAYTAGYSTIPGDLEQACIETCASWVKRKDSLDEQSKSIQGEVVSFSMASIPASAKLVLDIYTRGWPR